MPNSFRKFRKLELTIALLLLALVGVSLIPLDDDFYRQKLIDTLTESTDYQLEIAGSLKLYLSFTPGFKATQARIASP